MLDEETDRMTNELRLYYNLDNSKQLHGNDCQFVVIPDEMGLFVKKLFNMYPSFIKVSDLCDDNEQVNINKVTKKKKMICMSDSYLFVFILLVTRLTHNEYVMSYPMSSLPMVLKYNLLISLLF